MTADRTDLWLWKVWAELGKRDIQLLAQTHDSITFQFREDNPDIERSVIEYALGLLNEISLTDPKSGRIYIAPGAAKVGWNWAPFSKSNPGGLYKWKKGVLDERSRPSGLDRLLLA
jgi:hypothetical protein